MKPIITIFALFLVTAFNKALCNTDTANNTVLSITINSFSADMSEKQQVDIRWNTMMELNVDHFEIQRSGDGLNFQSIDSLKTKMKSNTNVYELQYDYTDDKPLPGNSYYRLVVVGRNGMTSQSTIVRISNSTDLSTRIYPTLIQNNLVYIDTDKSLNNVRIEFFDLSGNKISETTWSAIHGRENVQVSKTGTLHYGTYVARLTANGVTIKNQLVLIQ
jgi:hypothetical protein